MQKIGINEAIDKILQSDSRYDREAYVFLKDALEFTTKRLKKCGATGQCHVTGGELMNGVRDYALKEFGPMSATVLGYWGIHKTEDIGAIVFNLIEAGVFGRSPDDSIEHFAAGFDFHEAFVTPFLPPGRREQTADFRVEDRLL